MVNNSFHHVNHVVGSLLAIDLICPRGKFRQNVSLAVFNFRHEDGSATDAFLHKGGIGGGKFAGSDVARSQTQRHGRLQVVVCDAECVEVSNESLSRGVNLAHQPRCHPVVGLTQSPLERHHGAVACPASVSGTPPAVVSLHVEDGGLGRHAALESHGIDERFHR